MDLGFGSEACDHIRRIGRKPSSVCTDGEVDNGLRPRTIEVIFKTFKAKLDFYANLKYLRGMEQWENINFRNQLMPLQNAQERELLAIRAHAKAKGHTAFVKGGIKLIIDGETYTYDQLHKLPKGLSIEDASQASVDNDNGIAFAEQFSLLSNTSKCSIVYEGRKFTSTEAAFWFKKPI